MTEPLDTPVAQDAARFLTPHRLPARWAARRSFVVVLTEFGDARGFLALWTAWRADPARCERLHIVALAAPGTFDHPPAPQLADVWPMRVAGLHRLEFEGGRVVLTLAAGEPAQLLQKLWLRADAFDVHLAFDAPAAPAASCKAFARIAGDGATVAATPQPDLARALENAGFVCDTATESLQTAHFAPRWRVRRHEPPRAAGTGGNNEIDKTSPRHAIVIGAGLAGCAVSERLVSRGWRVTLIDRRDGVARDASGNPAGVFHPIVWRDDSVAARLTRAGFLLALERWSALERAGHDLQRSRDGLLQIADTAADAEALAQAIHRFGYPETYVRPVSREEASALAGVDVARGGWFFPHGGAVSPAAVCAAQCEQAGDALTRRFNTEVARLERLPNGWRAVSADGAEIASAPVAVLANAGDAERLAGLSGAPTRGVRGQLTLLDGGALDALRLPVIGEGYAVPLAAHRTLTGATYDLDDPDPDVRPDGHRENIARLAGMLPSAQSAADGPFEGRVAFRCVTSDRMPMIGALADETAARADAARLSGAWPLDLPRADGLYGAFAFGSRGLVWASLAAELIAAQIEGEPWPVERELAEAVDPARFLLRALRHGEAGYTRKPVIHRSVWITAQNSGE